MWWGTGIACRWHAHPLMSAFLSLVSYPPASKLHTNSHINPNLNKHSRLATIRTLRHALAALKKRPTIETFLESLSKRIEQTSLPL